AQSATISISGSSAANSRTTVRASGSSSTVWRRGGLAGWVGTHRLRQFDLRDDPPVLLLRVQEGVGPIGALEPLADVAQAQARAAPARGSRHARNDATREHAQ